MLAGISLKSRSLTRASTSAGEACSWAAVRSMVRVAVITSAAGTPLSVTSPITMPNRPSENGKKS